MGLQWPRPKERCLRSRLKSARKNIPPLAAPGVAHHRNIHQRESSKACASLLGVAHHRSAESQARIPKARSVPISYFSQLGKFTCFSQLLLEESDGLGR